MLHLYTVWPLLKSFYTLGQLFVAPHTFTHFRQLLVASTILAHHDVGKLTPFQARFLIDKTCNSTLHREVTHS